jgi:hypothetical protein
MNTGFVSLAVKLASSSTSEVLPSQGGLGNSLPKGVIGSLMFLA